MKSISIFIISLSFLSLPLLSQNHSLGIRGGLSVSEIGKPDIIYEARYTSGAWSLMYGYNFNDHLQVRISATHLRQGERYTGKPNNPPESSFFEVGGDMFYRSFKVPLQISYRFPLNFVHLRLNLGPGLAFYFDGLADYTIYDKDIFSGAENRYHIDVINEFDPETNQQANPFIGLGADLGFDLLNDWTFGVNFENHFELQDFYKELLVHTEHPYSFFVGFQLQKRF